MDDADTITVQAFRGSRWRRWLVRRSGGRAYLEGLDAYVEVLRDAQAALVGGHQPAIGIEFDWLWRDRIEAWTGESPRRIARMSTGCWSRIQGLCNQLMSCSDLLPEVAGGSSERNSLRGWLDQDFKKFAVGVEPISEPRQLAGYVLAEMALTLIVLHELGHHVLGHFREQTNMKGISETRRARHLWSPRGDDPSTRFEEVCADRFARAAIMHLIGSCQGCFPGQIVDETLQPHLGTLARAAHVVQMLALPGFDTAVAAFRQRGGYPHPLARTIACGLGECSESGLFEITDFVRLCYYAHLANEEWAAILQQAFDQALAVRQSGKCGERFDWTTGEWKPATSEQLFDAGLSIGRG